MTLTIVIVAFNAREHLARCLSSLTSAPPSVAHDIVVVDNASADGAPDMVRATFPGVRVLQAPHNVGFAAGNNIGIRESHGDLVLLLNPDTRVPAGAVDALIAELQARPGAAAIGPRLVDGAGHAELSLGPMPSPWGEAWQRLLGRGHARHLWPFRAWVEGMTTRSRAAAWVSGACLLVWRADAEAVGLMDERYFLYWEDVDFCAALRARGRTVQFTPAVSITHLRGRSAAGARTTATLAYRRGQLAFYRKWRPRWAPFLDWYLRVRGLHPAQLAREVREKRGLE